MEDKRKHPRFAVSSDKSCWLQYADDSKMVAGIRDISRKGMRIASDHPLHDTDEHNFVIKSSWLDHDIPVKVRIVWNDTSAGIRNYGARFISISPENVFELLDPLYHDWVEETSQHPEQYS
ncbi:MAG: PilZ domain-containing protein [Thermodesulfobacteriota bacterium]|nr:PilZ domain-containing protein [Thermodesulfobacteriota bacterium]